MDMLTTEYTRGIRVGEGKTKEVHQVGNYPDLVRITSTVDHGRFANETTCNVFRYLLERKIPVAFQEQVDARSFVARKYTMLPYTVVVHRKPDSSCLNRYPELKKKKEYLFPTPRIEFFLKTENKRWRTRELPYNDPYMCLKHIGEIRLFNPSTEIQGQEPFLILPDTEVSGNREGWDNFSEMSRIALQVFRLLEEAWGRNGGKLFNCTFAFGITSDEHLVLADAIDNDSWWVVKNGTYLNEGNTLEEVIANNQQVAEITKRFLLRVKDK